ATGRRNDPSWRTSGTQDTDQGYPVRRTAPSFQAPLDAAVENRLGLADEGRQVGLLRLEEHRVVHAAGRIRAHEQRRSDLNALRAARQREADLPEDSLRSVHCAVGDLGTRTRLGVRVLLQEVRVDVVLVLRGRGRRI